MSDTPSLPQLKSFGSNIISGKEKMVGTIVTFCLIAAGLVALNAALPAINTFLSGTLMAIGKLWAIAISLAGLAMFIWIATAKRTHTFLKLAFYWLARKATMAMVRYEPTTIMEIYANEYLEKRGQEFGKRKKLVDSKRRIVARAIEENKQSIKESTENSKTLKSRHFDPTDQWDTIENQSLFTEYASDIRFREASVANLEKQLQRLDMYLKILGKFQLAFTHRRNVVRNSVKILKTEYEAMQATSDATREIGGLFGGGDDMEQVFNMAVEFVNERIAFFESEVDSFMNDNLPVVTELDLKNEVAEDVLMARLMEMDKTADLLIDQAKEEETAGTDSKKLAQLALSSQPVLDKEMPTRRRYL